MAELIRKEDTLNQGRVKLNNAILDAEKAKMDAGIAKITAEEAKEKAETALVKSENTQRQLDTIVIEGDSSVEAAQARVAFDGTIYDTLKERLDTEHQQLNTSLLKTTGYVTNPSPYLGTGKKNKRFIVSIVVDDGPKTDITKLLPIIQEKNVPVGIAVVTSLVGKEHPRWGEMMTWDDLRMMEKYGAEILGHTHTHPNLTQLSLDEVEEEIATNKRILNEQGFIADGFVFPYNATNYNIERIVRKYFKYSFAKNGTLNQGEAQNFPLFDNQRIARTALGAVLPDNPTEGFPSDTTSLEYYKARVDWSQENNNWHVIMVHTHTDYFPEEQQQHLRDLIDYIRLIGGEIVSPREGFEIYGNPIQLGNHVGDNNFIIDAAGKIYSEKARVIVTGYDKFTVVNKPNDFSEQHITITPISYSESQNAGYPVNQGGILTTYRLSSANYTTYQKFEPITIGSNVTKKEVFERFSYQGEWSDWIPKIDGSVYINDINYTSESTIEEFPLNKITITRVSNARAQAGGFPSNRGGTLITYRLSTDYYVNKQEYIVSPQLNNGKRVEFVRYLNPDNTWGEWEDNVGKRWAQTRNFGSVGARSTKTVTITGLTGLLATDIVTVTTYINTLPEGLILTVHEVRDGEVDIRLANITDNPIDSGNCYYVVSAIKKYNS